MKHKMISDHMQDYLKAICQLGAGGAEVSTSAIAERLELSAASVTNMMKKLAELRLVRHLPYQGVELTPAGRKVALEVIRHHRLLELYLAESLGFSWDHVHDEAEKLEHHISEEFEDRIAASLGNPTRDPHGDPIPTRAGELHEQRHRSLAELPPAGKTGTVRRVSDQSPERLRYLAELGLRPETQFTVIERAPFHGPIRLRLGEKEVSVGVELAQEIFVTGNK